MGAGRKAGTVTTRPHPLQHLSLAWNGRAGQCFSGREAFDERFGEDRDTGPDFVGRRDCSGASTASPDGVRGIGFLFYFRLFSSMEGQQVVVDFAVLDAG